MFNHFFDTDNILCNISSLAFFHLANVFWHKNTFKKDFILIMDFKHLLTLGRDILGINFDLSLHFVVGSAFFNSVKTFFLPKKFFFVCAKYVSFVMKYHFVSHKLHQNIGIQ